MNIWRTEYENGVEIVMPHRPILDEAGKPILDADGYMRFEKCRVRSISAGYLLRSGKLPSALMDVMREVLKQLGVVKSDPNDIGDTLSQIENLPKFVEFAEFITREILVWPRLVNDPKKDDEISFAMLSNDDILFFVSLIEQPLAGLRTFRKKPDTGLERLPDAQIDESDSESGDRPSDAYQA